MSHAPAPTPKPKPRLNRGKLLILTNRDEDILRAIYKYHYVTSQDITRLLFSKGSLTHVREILSALSGGEDHQERNYLYRFQLPNSSSGNREKVYTLGATGRDLLASLGLSVDWYFRPHKTRNLSHSHILHDLILTRLVVAAHAWCRKSPDYTIRESRLCYELSRDLSDAQDFSVSPLI